MPSSAGRKTTGDDREYGTRKGKKKTKGTLVPKIKNLAKRT